VSSKIPGNEVDELPVSTFKYTPLQHVRTLYAAFVQGLFKAAPVGSGYHWDEDEERTEVVITDENPIHLRRIGSRPAINFTRGPVQSYNFGIDDMLSYQFNTGAKTKTILVPGTMSINCCSRVDLVSEQLAWVIAEMIWAHRDLLMQSGFFEIGRNFVVSSPSPAGSVVAGDSADEWYVTSVQSPFQFQRTTRVAPLAAQILQNIGIQFDQAARAALQSVQQEYNPAGIHNPSFQQNETYPTLRGTSNDDGLRRIPDPRNPAKTLTVRPARPNSRLVLPRKTGGVLPIEQETVEESTSSDSVSGTFKV